MAETFFIIILIVPAVLGMAEILHLFKVYLLGYTRKGKKHSIVFLDNEDAVITLRAFCEEKNWYGKPVNNRFFAVYKGLSEEVFAECREIAEKNDIILLNIDDLTDYIKEFY